MHITPLAGIANVIHGPSTTRRQRLPSNVLIAALICLSANRVAQGVVLNMSIRLDALQAGVTTTASGTGTATLDTATRLFTWSITFTNLSSAETAAHFHGPAPICDNAPVTIELPLGSPINGSMTLDPTSMLQVQQGLWYVNVHTQNNPQGEIRGQVVPAPLVDPIPGPIAPSAIHIKLEPLATGLTAPNWGTTAPGDVNRLFVVDQNGPLWAIDVNTGVRTTFHNVASLLVPLGVFGPNSFDERGFIGAAFHPNYQSNGLVYTFTSEPVNGPADFNTLPPGATPNCQTVIREWHVPDPSNPASVVDPDSSRVLLRINKPQFNHNAGGMTFGPDGLLYIAFGDGGGADDQDGQNFIGGPIIGHGCSGNGQNLNVILGKIIRIDPLGNNSANGHYGIPADNPFVGFAGLDEIWCYGLRNPFRFSFDRAAGTMYIADVGQNKLEEIDIGIRSGNYGWHHKEGSFFFITNGSAAAYVTDQPQGTASGLIDPIAQYDHDEGIAALGGFVYRGQRIAPLLGRYVFGDLARTNHNDGRLFMLGGSATNQIQEFPLVGQSALNLSVLGFGQDARGELYVMANATGIPFGTTGVVLRLATKPGDIDASGVVDINDLLQVILHWGACPPPPAICPVDIFPAPNGDGQVNVDDLLTVIANWG